MLTAEVARHFGRAQEILITSLRAPEKLSMLSDGDWDLLLRIARRTRLLGRIECDLAHAGLLDSIPPRVAAHLRAARNVIEHRKRLAAWEVNRIAWALEGIDGPLILLKGIAYVMADLPVARGRIFADVDLLVPEASIGHVEQRLVERGWMKIPIHPYDDRYYRVWTHEIPPLRHRERGTEIDIHHRLLPRVSRVRSDPGLLFAAARPLGASRLHVLAPCDMILHAIVHLFLEGDPHDGLRFRDLVDVHDLLCHHGGDADFWSELVARADALGFQRPLYYALHHARQILDTPVPVTALQQLENASPPWPLRKLMDGVMRCAMLPEHPDRPTASRLLSRWLVYLRAHWLRMPFMLLARHLAYKGWLRFRGVPDKMDLAQLDLRQQ